MPDADPRASEPASPHGPGKIIRYEDLNALGKTVYVAGAFARLSAGLIDAVLDRTARVLAEAERAFREGRAGDVEDAKVLEERHERRP